MRYEKHEKSDKGYIIMRCSGFGVMEANYVDEEIVFETDNKEDAYKEADRLLHENNSEETIKSSWIPNTYWVHANTNSEIGKAEYDKFRAESDETIRKAKATGNYHEHKTGDITIGVIGDDSMFKRQPKITGQAMDSVMWNGSEWVKTS